MPLNTEQESAVAAMRSFLDDDEPFFLLEGPAGTGKTYCVRELIPRVRGRILFTAPTNKATKVLRQSVASADYKPECRTIYSALGLRLEANGEVKELSAPEDPIDLSKFVCIVVDEGSMINKHLMTFIRHCADAQGVKFIFMGDRYQLPPVGEPSSPIWAIENRAALSQIMRFDNQILNLTTGIRNLMTHPCPSVKFAGDNDGTEGVWVLKSNAEFESRLRDAAHAGRFSRPDCAKAIAWRNATVDRLNGFIRAEIFDNADDMPWLPGDRIITTAPAKFLDEPIASTDDEGTVERVSIARHPIYGEFDMFNLMVAFDDNRTETLRLLHPDSLLAWNREKERRAAEARENRRLWKNFWEFCEAFHSARHGYAVTAHRAQGSTYEAAFVDWRDIFANRNRQEAMQCLYVAVSRPKKELYLT